MQNKFLVTHQPAGGASATDISDAVRIGEDEGILTSADSFQFSVQAKPKYESIFDDGGNIKIYFASGNGEFALVIDGFIKEIQLSIDKTKTWTVSGQNRLEVLLNAPIPAAYTSGGTNNNSALIIKNLIGLANSKWIKSKYSPTISAELKSAGGLIDDTKYTSSTLPSINYYGIDKPVYQQIEELSTPNFTGVDSNTVGNYIYYLDTSNRFVWQPRPTTVSSTINVGDFIKGDVKKLLFDVINFAVVDAGLDFNGRPIKTYAYSGSGQAKGFRGKYFAKPEIANTLRRGVTADAPFGTAAASGFADNAAFRNRVRDDAKAWGNKVVGTFGEPRFKATLTMQGTTAYQKGNLYTIAIPGVFKDSSDAWTNSLKLRLKKVSHTFSAKGWFTELDFEQDEKAV